MNCGSYEFASKAKDKRQTIIVVARQQNAAEEHRFRTATDALLMELVRQQLGRRES
jgi:hypothetical protein